MRCQSCCVYVCVRVYVGWCVRRVGVDGYLLHIEYENRSLKTGSRQRDSNSVPGWQVRLVACAARHGVGGRGGCDAGRKACGLVG